MPSADRDRTGQARHADRAFVHGEKTAHAVAGAVVVVQADRARARGGRRRPGARRSYPVGNTAVAMRDVAFQHAGGAVA